MRKDIGAKCCMHNYLITYINQHFLLFDSYQKNFFIKIFPNVFTKSNGSLHFKPNLSLFVDKLHNIVYDQSNRGVISHE